MKLAASAGAVFLAVATAHGAASVTPWVPIFKGIDQATGTNDMSANGTLSVNAIRIDLQDPDVHLMITSPTTNNYVPDQRETLMQTPREFLAEHELQVAINSGYFSPAGYTSPSGTPASLQGAVISQGRLVSAQTRSNDSMSAIFFTTNNQATFHFTNWPAASTDTVFNAVSGMFPLVSNGVNFAYFYTNALSDTVHQAQPRTAFGLSEDNRYLIMITIDGRQAFSDGAFDYETAEFLLLFGAWNGMNMDGGGSTCMVKADEFGDAVDVNVNSFQFAVARPGSQRPVGCNFGVRTTASASPIKDLVIDPGSSTAIFTWRTDEPATTQVEFGLTKSLGSATPLDSRPVKMHIATLAGLSPGSNYYFRAVSDTGSASLRRAGQFSTTGTANRSLLFDITKSWRYTTNGLDGTPWTTLGYDDSGWMGEGPGLLYAESSTSVNPKNTLLPPGIVPTGTPFPRAFYFRTHFDFTGASAGATLLFSNYIDDGAVFYLNGAETYRLRMPAFPSIITNGTQATGTPTNGDATTPDIFNVSGGAVDNLVNGDNVLAVEVHNFSGVDVVFGSALFVDRPLSGAPRLNIAFSDNEATLYWNGSGFTLQQAVDLGSGTNSVSWADVPGPATTSPVVIGNTGSMFYRLRN